MYPILLDTKTGKTFEAKKMEASLFWWADGNGSCDCNRAIVGGEEIVDELDGVFGIGTCYGCKRIVAIDVKGDLEGVTKKKVLEEMNSEYPEELRPLWDKL